ncbi:MAG: isoprenyl transferase [Defluviitaleaceae bacterium]|nr:isoprenyl transferase [Defluviitaleaceae bacterium]
MGKGDRAVSAPFPRHIGIIMDGNGRWAKKFLLKREAGHRAGAQTLRKLVEGMNEAGFEVLTVYAFSTENWTRDDGEVAYLMGLISEYIQQYIDEADKGNGRVRVIGDRSRLSVDLQQRIAMLEQMTADKNGILLNIAINYGGRDDIVRAVRAVAADVAAGKLALGEISERHINEYIDTAPLPDPELIIRTSGEMRLSNFLLWQAAYSEFYATPILWPDFKISHLYEAIEHYNKRQRRFGGRKGS